MGTDNYLEVYILAGARTPIGGFNGSLASFSAVDLGVIAVKGALNKANVPASDAQEVYFGNVVSAGNGQNVARQVSVNAGIPKTTPCTSINKVCASGMKAIALGAQSILLGQNDVVVAGGTESMSNAPYLMPKARFGAKFGHTEILDSLQSDGLSDAFGKFLMGNAAEECVKEHGLTREDQDNHAISSYQRAQAATAAGKFDGEIIPIEVSQGKGKPPKVVKSDDEITNLNPEKLRQLRPIFDPKGTVTPANSSPLSDGAAAVVLVSGKKLQSYLSSGLVKKGIKVFKIMGFADAEQEPVKFTTTPSVAVPIAIKRAGLEASSINYYELNEAFSCVAVANAKLLNLDDSKVNVYGGAVAMGHPLGCSGARVIVTLCSVLKGENAKNGCAGICNGGGGASAMVIQKVDLD
ncbi:Thiolase, N-terminal domain-containing protein [Paraphysoderma sedebokerense]|nr:Thiolase, N-terminal domain-containing protein [Paraphysoderma sedebokerense]